MARNRQSKLAERAKKTRQQKANDPQHPGSKKKKNDLKKTFLFQPNVNKGTDRIFKGTNAASCVHKSPEGQLLMLTHVHLIQFAFMSLRLNYVLNC